MKTNRTQGQTLAKLNLNEKTRTITIDIFSLYGEKFDYMYSAKCKKMKKEDFDYFYNNIFTFSDIRNILIPAADIINAKYKEL